MRMRLYVLLLGVMMCLVIAPLSALAVQQIAPSTAKIGKSIDPRDRAPTVQSNHSFRQMFLTSDQETVVLAAEDARCPDIVLAQANNLWFTNPWSIASDHVGVCFVQKDQLFSAVGESPPYAEYNQRC